MTNWKADPKVQEAIQNLTTMYLRNDWTMADERRNIDALCEVAAASGSPAEVPPNWNAFEEVKQARAELARAWDNDVQGNIDMAIRPSDLFDKLCAAVWRSAHQ